jgi:hypothetical protein
LIGWVEGEEDVEGEEPEGDGGRGGGRGSRDQPDEILRERFGEVAGYDEEEQPVTAPIGGGGAQAASRRRVHVPLCFLIKHRRQLADPVRLICKDCADPR